MSMEMQEGPPKLPDPVSRFSRFASIVTPGTWEPSVTQMESFDNDLISDAVKLRQYQALQARTSFYKGLAYGATGGAGVIGALAIVKIVAAGTLLAIGPIGWGVLAFLVVLTVAALIRRHMELKWAIIETDTLKTMFKTIAMSVFALPALLMTYLLISANIGDCKISWPWSKKMEKEEPEELKNKADQIDSFNLTERELNKLKDDHMKEWSLETIRKLSEEQIKGLSPGYQLFVRGLRANCDDANIERIQQFSIDNFNSLKPDDVEHLTRDQLKGLTKADMKKLPVVIDALSDEQIENLADDAKKYMQNLRAIQHPEDDSALNLKLVDVDLD